MELCSNKRTPLEPSFPWWRAVAGYDWEWQLRDGQSERQLRGGVGQSVRCWRGMWWVGAKGLQGKLTFAVNRRRAVRLAQDLITACQNRVHLHPQRLPPLLTQSHYLYFSHRLLVSLCLSPLPLWEWHAHTVWKQSRTGRRGGNPSNGPTLY